LALPLIVDLEKKGYIVITSVATLKAVETIERECHGYVRALVLDPDEVCIIYKVVYISRLMHFKAWNDTDLPPFPRIDTVPPFSYQYSGRSSRFPILTPLHSLCHITSHSTVIFGHDAPNTFGTPAYPVYLPALLNGYSYNSNPHVAGVHASSAHLSSPRS